jgi:hypothetical protein
MDDDLRIRRTLKEQSKHSIHMAGNQQKKATTP